jgi:predicted aspartyl protease
LNWRVKKLTVNQHAYDRYAPEVSCLQRNFAGLLAFAVATALLSGCATSSPRTTDAHSSLLAETDADWPGDVLIALSQRDGYLLVPTVVNGQPAGWLMLDTGANQVVLDEGLANRLGLAVVGKGQSTGIAGQAEVRIREVQSLSIGPGRVAQDPTDAGVVRVELLDRNVLSLSMLKLSGRLGGGINGLIGFPSLAEVPFTLDVKDERSAMLTLHDPESFRPPSGAVSVPLRIYRRLPVVEAIVGQPGVGRGPVRVGFILDWGSDHGVSLPSQLMRQRPDLASVNVAGTSQVQGVGGTATNQETWARSITLFGQTLEHEPISIENLPPAFAEAHLPIGRLGHVLMRRYRMTFDLARQQLYVVPK